MSTINLSDKDNNAVISANKDDNVQITLVSKPSTGFTWQEDTTTAGTLIELRHERENPMIPGGNASVTFIFRIDKTGVIVLNFSRPWETTPPAKLFQVQVNVN